MQIVWTFCTIAQDLAYATSVHVCEGQYGRRPQKNNMICRGGSNMLCVLYCFAFIKGGLT